MVAVAALASSLAVGLVVLVIYAIVRRSNAYADELASALKAASALRVEIDDLDRAVEDRDQVIAAKEAENLRLTATLAVTEGQRDDAIKVLESMAATDPRSMAHVIRRELERLRSFSSLSDVPPAAPAEDR